VQGLWPDKEDYSGFWDRMSQVQARRMNDLPETSYILRVNFGGQFWQSCCISGSQVVKN
jgi:hypothetical protein